MNLLSNLPKRVGQKEGKRKGRGPGSGNGKTAGRGHKGQKARSGCNIRPGFEGGQMPLFRKVPKRGPRRSVNRVKMACVNLSDIEKCIEGVEIVDAVVLHHAGLIPCAMMPLKVLGTGEIGQALTIHAQAFSESAKEKIEKAGGKAVLL